MAPEPAPLVVRTPAFLIDQVVVTLLVVLPALTVGVGVEKLVSPGGPRQDAFLVAMGVAFVYHAALEYQTGQTLGKSVFDLEVVSDDGSPLGPRGAVLRNALRLFDGLGYWSVAVVVILWRGDGKRIGDVVGRTLVVRE